MPAEKFPFAFDAAKFNEFFAAAKMPTFDFEAMLAAQQKNVDAVIEANKVLVAGYQDVFKRQAALAEAAIAEAKDRFETLQGQPMTADQAKANIEVAKTAFDKAMVDFKELAELAQKANTGAFEIVKARVEDSLAEIKAATDKIAA